MQTVRVPRKNFLKTLFSLLLGLFVFRGLYAKREGSGDTLRKARKVSTDKFSSRVEKDQRTVGRLGSSEPVSRTIF